MASGNCSSNVRTRRDALNRTTHSGICVASERNSKGGPPVPHEHAHEQQRHEARHEAEQEQRADGDLHPGVFQAFRQ